MESKNETSLVCTDDQDILFGEMQEAIDVEIVELPRKINRRMLFRTVVSGAVLVGASAFATPALACVGYNTSCECNTPGGKDCNYNPNCASDVNSECNGGSSKIPDTCIGKDTCIAKDSCTITFENNPGGGGGG